MCKQCSKQESVINILFWLLALSAIVIYVYGLSQASVICDGCNELLKYHTPAQLYRCDGL